MLLTAIRIGNETQRGNSRRRVCTYTEYKTRMQLLSRSAFPIVLIKLHIHGAVNTYCIRHCMYTLFFFLYFTYVYNIYVWLRWVHNE